MCAATYDRVLEYLSARKSGSWVQFKSAVMAAAETENSDESPTWATSVFAANLAMLCHVDFAFESNLQWTCAPPVLAQTATKSEIGVLLGRRDSRIEASIAKGAAALHIALERLPQDYAPTALLLHSPDPELLETLAGQCGLPFAPDAALLMSRCLPSLASMYLASPTVPFPHGFPVEIFDPESFEWKVVRTPSGDGSYRIDSYRPEFRVVVKGRITKVTQNLGIHVALAQAGKRAVEYLPSPTEMRFHSRAKLPELYMRALALCEGRLPRFDRSRGELFFRSVPEDVADYILEGIRSLEGCVSG